MRDPSGFLTKENSLAGKEARPEKTHHETRGNVAKKRRTAAKAQSQDEPRQQRGTSGDKQKDVEHILKGETTP